MWVGTQILKEKGWGIEGVREGEGNNTEMSEGEGQERNSRGARRREQSTIGKELCRLLNHEYDITKCASTQF